MKTPLYRSLQLRFLYDFNHFKTLIQRPQNSPEDPDTPGPWGDTPSWSVSAAGRIYPSSVPALAGSCPGPFCPPTWLAYPWKILFRTLPSTCPTLACSCYRGHRGKIGTPVGKKKKVSEKVSLSTKWFDNSFGISCSKNQIFDNKVCLISVYFN